MTPLRPAIAFALTLLVSPVAAESPVLGQGRGLDHMGVAVRDLAEATRDFRALGFDVQTGGRFPGGLSNAICFFGDRFYLEILTVAPDHGKEAADVADFLRKHEGAMFVGLNTASAKATSDFLRSRDFDVVGPEPGSVMTGNETKLPPPMWYDVYTQDKPAKGKRVFALPIFFIQYTNTQKRDAERARHNVHFNGVLGVRAIWFTVKDLKARLAEMKAAGFAPGRAVSFAGRNGRALAAGAGDMNLLQSSSQDDGTIMGVSLRVADIDKARAIAEIATKAQLAVHDGPYGKSFLIPPTAAHGVWIEMVQN